MERIWFFSPAIATLIFFAVQIVLAFGGTRSDTALQGANVEAPKSANVKVHVVEQIRPVHADTRASSAVPATEAELMSLFERDEAIIFFSDEVEVLEPRKLRPGRLVR